MRKKSTDFQKKIENIDLKKSYTVQEALEMIKELSYEKFDASIEVHVKTGIDPKKGDQQVRGAETDLAAVGADRPVRHPPACRGFGTGELK